MKTLPLGRTGAEVNALCLGCMDFGTNVDEERSFQLLDQYIEAGGTFLDTANNYSYWNEGGVGGESEALLGRWFRERRNRDRIFLATKVGFNTLDVGHSLSAETIVRELDGSLKRMGTDYVDLYYAHKDHRADPLEETLEAFDRLVTAGKVRYIGCSNTLAWRIERARTISRSHGWAEYCCVQQRFSYLRPKPGASFGNQVSANADLLDYCRQKQDVTFLAYSPLLGGCYTRRDKSIPEQYQGPDADARMVALRRVAKDVGATPNQVVYAWMLQGKPNIVPLVAASNKEQMAENLGSLEVKLSREQMELLTNTTG
ncbi:MAG TPA: aldo/keto reductase [Anaerolineae bacterium]|nr:aldo/keto reductase [Anaerolineae bacterium]